LISFGHGDYVSLYILQQARHYKRIEKGHDDLKDKQWWPTMQTLQDLIQSWSIIIWTTSALHAAVNFGQYLYGGFILNRPTLGRRWIPEKGTPEYEEMVKNPQKPYLRTITSKGHYKHSKSLEAS